MMKIQSVDTDLLIISHICTQDDECWMEVAFIGLGLGSFYRGGLWKMQQEMKNKKDGEDQTGPFLGKLERECIEYIMFS